MAKVSNLLQLASLRVSLFVLRKFEYRLIIGIEGNGSLERIPRLAAYKSLDHGCRTVHHQGSELGVGQFLFRNGAENGKSAIPVVAFGNLRVKCNMPVPALGATATGSVVIPLKRDVEQFPGDLRGVYLY